MLLSTPEVRKEGGGHPAEGGGDGGGCGGRLSHTFGVYLLSSHCLIQGNVHENVAHCAVGACTWHGH